MSSFSCISKRALSGPFTVLFSIVKDLEGITNCSRKTLLNPQGWVRFERSFKTSPRSQNPSHRAVIQNRPTLNKPFNPFSEVGRRSLKELCEGQKILSVPPENLTRGSRLGYETLRALCKFRPLSKGGGIFVFPPSEPRNLATSTKT